MLEGGGGCVDRDYVLAGTVVSELRMLGFAVIALLLIVIGVTNASHLSSSFSLPTAANVVVVSTGQEAGPLQRRSTDDDDKTTIDNNEKEVRANLRCVALTRSEDSSSVILAERERKIHISQLLSYGGIIERGGGSLIDSPTTTFTAASLLPFLFDTQSTRSSLTKVYSLTSLVIAQSINIACMTFVVSGYFGAYVASWMIHAIRNRIVPKLVLSSSTSSSSSISSSSLSMIAQMRDYRWVTLALLGILLPYVSSSCYYNNLDKHRMYDDVVFSALLSLYSYIVDPLLGGLIGCTHVIVGLTSSIIGNTQLGNMIGRLNDVRYCKLYNDNNDDEFDDGSSLAYVDPIKRTFRIPVVTSGSIVTNSITTKIIDMLASSSLLVVSSQHFLGLYMLGTTLVSLWSKYYYHNSEQQQQSMYQEMGQRIIGGIGQSKLMIEDVAQWWLGGIDCPWKLPKRLVTLYWLIMLSKMGVAYIY
jgi:hypothetical protein